ncbi:MAG: CBS domain-containing protein [Zoogloea sp.]|uniref:CBS domain-containing protein n=1 Tax=Zoogloea sp. TaxID=49181 RepID=UPI00260AF32F|nr:CBS domain-containing protein [Zoogloea sp.]MDD2990141.1 CBS domain-containing protein [Zoogloea sp.]
MTPPWQAPHCGTLKDIRSPITLRLPAEMPLTEALNTLLQHGVSGAIVMCDEGYVGIITERSAARACLDGDPASLMLGEACDPNLPVGHPDTDLREAYRLLVRHGSRHIRIEDTPDDPGVLISETELLGALGVEHFTHLATVGHVMSPRLHTIPATSGVDQAIRQMRQYNIGCVVAESAGQPVGVFTFHDLTLLLSRNARIADITLAQVMTPNPLSIQTSTSVWSAARTMQQARIRHLLVMHGGSLVGILSEHDIVTSLEGRYVAFLREVIAEQEQELIDQRVRLARREGEERLHRIIESTPDVILVKDGENRWLITNRAGLEFFGLTGVNYVGHTEEELAGLTEPPRAAPLLNCAATNEQAWLTPEGCRYIDRLPGPDGTMCHLDVIKTPVFNPDGSRQMLVVVGRDITDRMQMEEQVRALNATLEERVARRTDELSATLAELESFSYSVSHDLRPPLRAIEGFSSVVMDEHAATLGPEGMDHLNRVREAARRMASLIDDLLDLSRHVRKPLQRRDTDLSATASSIARDFADASPERDVCFEIESGIHAECDPVLLRTVLENLIGNAWKFTRPVARPCIRFGQRQEPEGTAYFVADNGVGFNRADATKLFTPFQRFHAAAEFEGSGIGLATVHRIVRRHGGWIRAESRPNQGALFMFSLGA